MTEPFHARARRRSLFEEWFDSIPDDPLGTVRPVELVATDPLPQEPVTTSDFTTNESSGKPVEQEAPVAGEIRAAPVADDILARVSAGLSRPRPRQPLPGEARAVGPMPPPAPALAESAAIQQPAIVVSQSVLNGDPVRVEGDLSSREMPTVISSDDDEPRDEPARRGFRWKAALAILAGALVASVLLVLLFRSGDASSRSASPPLNPSAEVPSALASASSPAPLVPVLKPATEPAPASSPAPLPTVSAAQSAPTKSSELTRPTSARTATPPFSARGAASAKPAASSATPSGPTPSGFDHL